MFIFPTQIFLHKKIKHTLINRQNLKKITKTWKKNTNIHVFIFETNIIIKIIIFETNFVIVKKMNVTFDYTDGFSKFKNSQKA